MKIITSIAGFMLSIGWVGLGLALTNYLNNAFWVITFSIIVPIIGYYLFKSKYKYLGAGVLFSSIPLALVIVLFILISQLH